LLTASSLLSDVHLNPSVLPAPPCLGRSAAVPAIDELQSAGPRGRIDELHRAVSKALLRLPLFQLSPLGPWQIPGHVRARMQHKHKQARRRGRRALEVASFVPGHARNRGATPGSSTALCSKRNKVATPCHSNRVERRRHDAPCAGAQTSALEPHRTARPARRARACRLVREPHRGLGWLFVRKGTNLFIRTAWSGDGMTPHAQEPAPVNSNRIMAAPAAPCPCAPAPSASVARCFYFGRKTDCACQDVSVAAGKRARWNCRWHPTTAGPMDDCCSLLLAALAWAGRAGAHSSVPMLHRRFML